MGKKGQIPWNKKDKIELFCRICKKSYLVHPCRSNSKYCSLACYQNSKDIKLYGKGNKHPQWKGGRQKGGNKDYPYIYLYLPKHPLADKRGRYAEHRYVMEKKMGRYLKKGEVVHHINGVRNDNRPENLELYLSNGEHMRKELKGKKLSKGIQVTMYFDRWKGTWMPR